jgi:hypothetical protein
VEFAVKLNYNKKTYFSACKIIFVNSPIIDSEAEADASIHEVD